MTINQTRWILCALRAHGGNVALTAAAIGLPRDVVAAIAARTVTQ